MLPTFSQNLSLQEALESVPHINRTEFDVGFCKKFRLQVLRYTIRKCEPLLDQDCRKPITYSFRLLHNVVSCVMLSLIYWYRSDVFFIAFSILRHHIFYYLCFQKTFQETKWNPVRFASQISRVKLQLLNRDRLALSANCLASINQGDIKCWYLNTPDIWEHLKNEKKRKNPRLRLVFSLFPSCSQMFVVFYPSAIYSLRFFLCKAMETKWLYIDHNVRFNTSTFLSHAVLTYYGKSLLLKYVLLRKKKPLTNHMLPPASSLKSLHLS